jgi:transcriptional regulator GlxA family with amidase domain
MSTSSSRAPLALAAGFVVVAMAAALGIVAAIRAAVVLPQGAQRLPPTAPIRVAFVITDGATMIDFAGPWEVFQDSQVQAPRQGFQLYTVGAGRQPVRVSGGMAIVPDYDFADAPAPAIVVVGAQRGAPALAGWLRQTRRTADVMMSVCTGAFQFGAAGLLDGKPATTHHDFYDQFAARFPAVKLQRGQRFVQSDPVVYTAGGLTSGIDLALHIVETYFGREVAADTARYMEYRGTEWSK